ncbi:MAG: hypothetical protein OXB93_07115 [Cytophagales bacterium]|nr:hypothetical protein [Cytophagales bacterium]
MNQSIFLCSSWFCDSRWPLGIPILLVIGLIFLFVYHKKGIDLMILCWTILGALFASLWVFRCYLREGCESNGDKIRGTLAVGDAVFAAGALWLSARRTEKMDKQIKASQEQVEASQEANYLSKRNQALKMSSPDE